MKSVYLDVVGYTPRNKVLEYFVMARKLDVTISEIIDEYGMNKATTYNVVRDLLKEKKIVPTKKIGNTQLYRINLKDSTCQMLVEIFNKCIEKVCEEYAEKEKITIKPKKKKH